jgi:hypothetical protein
MAARVGGVAFVGEWDVLCIFAESKGNERNKK